MVAWKKRPRRPMEGMLPHQDGSSQAWLPGDERAFRTLQDRLPKELKLAGITTVAAANRWLAAHYIPAHNAAFAVAAEPEGSGFVADPAGLWVHEDPDGRIAVFLGPHRLAEYDAAGAVQTTLDQAA